MMALLTKTKQESIEWVKKGVMMNWVPDVDSKMNLPERAALVSDTMSKDVLVVGASYHAITIGKSTDDIYFAIDTVFFRDKENLLANSQVRNQVFLAETEHDLSTQLKARYLAEEICLMDADTPFYFALNGESKTDNVSVLGKNNC